MKTRDTLAAIFSLALVILAGCRSVPHVAEPPAATITTPSGATIKQTGDTPAPAKVETTRTKHTLPVPAALVWFDEKLGRFVYQLSGDSVATVETVAERAEGPKAFEPPAPPTAAEIAQADGVRYFWLAALGCTALAGLLAWRAHYLAAVCAGLAAVALPILARFVSTASAVTIGAALVVAAVCFFAAWHIERAKARGV